MNIKKIYNWLNEYDYPVLLEDEIKMGDISLSCNYDGYVVISRYNQNELVNVYIDTDKMDDGQMAMEIMRVLITIFDWEV